MFDAHPPEAYVGGRIDESDVLAAFPLLMQQIFGITVDPAADPPASVDEALSLLRLPGAASQVLGDYRRFMRVWQHNHSVLKRWYPDETYDGPVTIFEASDAEDAELLDRLRIKRVGKGPWRTHLTGTLRIEPVPGDHYTMFADPSNVKALGEAWNRVLEV